MRLIKFKKETFKIVPAVCFSVLIHAALGGLFVFGPSGNIITPPGLNGLNLVWVSLGSNNKGSRNTLSGQKAPDGPRLVKKQTSLENSISKLTAPVIYTAMKSTSPIKSAGGYAFHTGAFIESSGNMNVRGGGNQALGGTPSDGAFTAYPLYRENMPPVYPEIARIRGYEGVVLIAAEILPNGRVGSARIRKSSGYSILDQSALEAVKPWRFEPAKKSGLPVTMWVEVPIKFVLQNDKSSS